MSLALPRRVLINNDHEKGQDKEESCGEATRGFQNVTKSSDQSGTNPIYLSRSTRL